MWTLDELVDRVEDALSAGYPGAPNGRVRGVPDRRAVRWYATIGLVDRPLGMRGRTALYGPRHLLQLVAVKRRQAEGRLLADIQAELAGADDETLAAVARVPEALLTDVGPGPDEPVGGGRERFWAASPALDRGPLPESGQSKRGAAPLAGSEQSKQGAAPLAGSEQSKRDPLPHREQSTPAAATPMGAVRLPGGAVLVLPGNPTHEDLAAIAAAAEPLIRTLAARGLADLTTAGTREDGSPS